MDVITLTKENLEKEHICCAISNNKDCQVAAKKAWIARQLDAGLMFKKCDVRGKCFIEYIPAEEAWAPILAEGYMYIDCLWVSGKFKGQGYSTLLLDECIKDSRAKGKKGLAVLSSPKKGPISLTRTSSDIKASNWRIQQCRTTNYYTCLSIKLPGNRSSESR